ncbi:hypothetical protein [Flavobacterium sp.]|jgi:cell filamentation protein|uniref:hypothetical protein n=1 Tax=Flavobacterium sp. TaxID=239 RepID=UPI0037C11C49
MTEQLKISIRFFDDREVRAVWDDEYSKWWFSVLDIVGVLNEEADYTKVRNYWKYLKAKLKKENNQLVSVTTQLKLMAADGIKNNPARASVSLVQITKLNFLSLENDSLSNQAMSL